MLDLCFAPFSPQWAQRGRASLVITPDATRFHLEPQRRIDRKPVGYTMIGLDGAFDPASRRLSGTIASSNCSSFDLTPSGPPRFQAPPAAPAIVPPERRRMVTNATNFADNGFEYWDSAMSDPQGTPRESEPIEDVIEWLRQQKFSRVGTRHVSWDASGTKGAVSDQISVRERFVIEWTSSPFNSGGNCRAPKANNK